MAAKFKNGLVGPVEINGVIFQLTCIAHGGMDVSKPSITNNLIELFYSNL
jgi:hypothetical protein